jgi:hypothetical protein
MRGWRESLRELWRTDKVVFVTRTILAILLVLGVVSGVIEAICK